MRRVILALCLALPCLAQPPAPSAEVAAPAPEAEWSAEAAMTWSWLRGCADEMRVKGPDGVLGLPVFQQRMQAIGSAFAASCFSSSGDRWTQGNPSRVKSWVIYFWPLREDDPLGRAFCLVSDGGLLVSPNGAGYCGRDKMPAPEAATGSGSRGRWADLLPQAGKGADGDVWQTRETLRIATLGIVVQDEHGTPLPHAHVLLVPDTWLAQPFGIPTREGCAPLPHAAPAGSAFTNRQGEARLDGPAARGLFACAGDDSHIVMLPPRDVRFEGGRLLLTYTRQSAAEAQVGPNEKAAIQTLRAIASAQAQCQVSGCIDADQDGVGEHGCFAELSGAAALHGLDGAVTQSKIDPPVLPVAFHQPTEGVVQRRGYCFRVFLAGKAGQAVSEDPDGKGMAGIAVDPQSAETSWCCYAWPITSGETGRRVFFVDQAGDVLASGNQDGRYSGAAKAPSAAAARARGSEGGLGDPAARHGMGNDGQTWTVVQ